MPRDYWHRLWTCPFFVGSEMLEVQCEGGRIVFPDKTAARQFFELCAAEDNHWKDCPIAAYLWNYYERMEEIEKNKKKRNKA